VGETDPARATRLVENACAATERGLHDVRRSVTALRGGPYKTMLEELRGLLAAAESAGLETDLVLEGSPYEPAAMVSLAVYRVVQEGMTNGLRHGKASRVRVTLIYGDSDLRVRVEDNGAGAKAIAPGGGLRGIAERLALLGGDVEVDAVLGAGVRLAARLPVRRSIDG
jgi:signal transduction histidine kinase